jgi:DNA-binding NarL/FixJ family response regulator
VGIGGAPGEVGLTLSLDAVDESRHTPSPPCHSVLPQHAPTTVLLARFDDLFARGLRALIDSDPSLVVLAADVEHRRIGVVVQTHGPDVAILNVEALSRFAEVRDLSSRHPATRFVLLAENPSMTECAQLLAFGASACLGRRTQSRDVLSAIHLASRGLQITPRIAPIQAGGPGAGDYRLTPREAEVLPLLQQGHSNAQIALELHVGVETVRTHARNIYRKLGVSSRRELSAPRARDQAPEPSSAQRAPGRRTSALHARRGHGAGHR